MQYKKTFLSKCATSFPSLLFQLKEEQGNDVIKMLPQ